MHRLTIAITVSKGLITYVIFYDLFHILTVYWNVRKSILLSKCSHCKSWIPDILQK